MGFMEWVLVEFYGILGLLYIPKIALTSVPAKTFFSFKFLI